MKNWLWLLVLTGGCIEYEPSSTLPPAGVANPRALAVSTQTDKLVQVEVPEVDILWVVDNSGSMSNEQTALGENFPTFMEFFLGSGLDYHMGVTTTDMVVTEGILQGANGYKFLDDETYDPEGVFAQMVDLGTGGSSTEKGRDAAYAAVEIQDQPYSPNYGFTREDASLHIVVVSDEDDHSTQIPKDEFVDYLKNLKWAEDMVTFSSIVSLNNTCGIEEGTDYRVVTAAVGGEEYSICAENWRPMLEALGLQASGLRREYFLSEIPLPSSIVVWVEEQSDTGVVTFNFEEETDWTYDQSRNSITFETYVPNALSSVFVDYEVLSASENDI
jgi:hypothetical protein